MIAEGNTVFTHAKGTGNGLDAYFDYCAEIEGDAIKKLTIYADRQKPSNAFQSALFGGFVDSPATPTSFKADLVSLSTWRGY